VEIKAKEASGGDTRNCLSFASRPDGPRGYWIETTSWVPHYELPL